MLQWIGERAEATIKEHFFTRPQHQRYADASRLDWSDYAAAAAIFDSSWITINLAVSSCLAAFFLHCWIILSNLQHDELDREKVRWMARNTEHEAPDRTEHEAPRKNRARSSEKEQSTKLRKKTELEAPIDVFIFCCSHIWLAMSFYFV